MRCPGVPTLNGLMLTSSRGCLSRSPHIRATWCLTVVDMVSIGVPRINEGEMFDIWQGYRSHSLALSSK
jgi:hypothetical protein